MQWQIAPLFATPVFKLTIDGAEKAKALFEAKIKNNTPGDDLDTQGGLSHFHSRSNIFTQYPELDWLKTQLEEGANLVYRDLLNYKKSGPMRITNAWINECNIDGEQPMHAHVNCLLCGTLYLHADMHTKLVFEHPLNNSPAHPELFDTPDSSENAHGLKFHLREAQIGVQAGECLYWPSQLRHGYQKNKTPGRLSLSFNMMPEKLNVDYQLL